MTPRELANLAWERMTETERARLVIALQPLVEIAKRQTEERAWTAAHAHQQLKGEGTRRQSCSG
jgi:hypothetical protein